MGEVIPWREIQRRAQSADEFDRMAALAHAVGKLELGLDAVGIDRRRREGLKSRLSRSRILETLKAAPTPAAVHSAIYARNFASHDYRVPETAECTAHVGTLYDVWSALRRSYVTKSRASNLAAGLLRFEAISDVFLFGSLARGVRYPNDIDLLLFDDGEFSFFSDPYGPTLETLVQGLSDIAAARCGWLDLVIVDGARFAKDKGYTLGLVASHPDPLFFVNISDGLLKYETRTKKWVKDRPQLFERLANIRRHLQTEHMVPPPGTERRLRQSREQRQT